MLWSAILLAGSFTFVDGTHGGVAAEKDFKVAEFYRRTGHPASAVFYYETVCRRYPGTDVAERAKGRIAEIKK